LLLKTHHLMNKPPYSLKEAENLRKEFQYLAGKPFNKECSASIDCIAIAPFDEISKKRFLVYYLLFDDAEMALNHEYKGLLYDVLVLAGSKDHHELLQEDIHKWLAKNKCMPAYRTEVAELIPMPVALAYL
jgi:hypothetical protein